MGGPITVGLRTVGAGLVSLKIGLGVASGDRSGTHRNRKGPIGDQACRIFCRYLRVNSHHKLRSRKGFARLTRIDSAH